MMRVIQVSALMKLRSRQLLKNIEISNWEFGKGTKFIAIPNSRLHFISHPFFLLLPLPFRRFLQYLLL